MGKISKKSKVLASEMTQNLENQESTSDSDENFDRQEKEEEIDVEFEAFGICDKDIDGIVALLKQAYAHEKNFDVRGVAEILANQEGRGCIFMTATDNDEAEDEDNDDDEIYGVVSYIDLKENFCVKFMQILREKCSKNEEIGKILENLENGQKKGVWVINERLLNLPYHIALPALKNLAQELEKSGQNYDYFILISKINKLITDNSDEQKKKVKKAKKRKMTSATDNDDNDSDVIYLNAEEEFLSEECKLQYDYVVENDQQEQSSSSALKPHRRVLIFDRSIFERFLSKLERDITNNCD